MSLRVVISGGGTGGHVYPALAIAEALRQQKREIDIRFVGTAKGFESSAVRSASETYHVISAGGLVGKSTVERIRGTWRASLGVMQSLSLIRTFRPHAVIGTGGYVMGPVVWAAQLLGIPTFLQEQNSYPGLTTRKLARKSKAVFLGFADAAQHLHSTNTVLTGNPLRSKLIESSEAGKRGARQSHLLILGGSQGAQSINRAVAASLGELSQAAVITWQYGKSGIPSEVNTSLIKSLTESGRLIAEPFFSDMQVRYSTASLIMCRAGAMTLAEIALYGLPSILVPFPHAAHDHQTANAASFVQSGAAVVLADSELNCSSLASSVLPLLKDDVRLDRMSACARLLAKPSAAKDIAQFILAYLKV